MGKKYYSSKYSKIFTLNSILKVIKSSEHSTDKLMIHTANGIYVGTLKEPTDYDNLEILEDDDLLTSYRKMYLTASDNYENNKNFDKIEKVSENPVSIILENVELLTSVRSINMPFAEIFIDQIIGFSIGSIS